MAKGSSKPKASRAPVEVEEMLEKMDIFEAERDSVILSKEDWKNPPELKWMVVSCLPPSPLSRYIPPWELKSLKKTLTSGQ